MAKVKLLDPADSKRRLDRYELIGELASGGMATVYLARLAGVGGFQRFVAIKRLHPHLASEDEFIEMFLDEARLAAGIHHPHVVPILEVGHSDAGYYLVMEYIEGDTLARIVARALSNGQAVPRPILLRILLDSLAGLHAAHELTDPHGQPVNLIHRDCSPQNVLVGVDGCSRITDFGVARASSRIANTRTDRVKGKLAYMSPEQAQGVTDLDRRADLFAMGVILWEVLAGRRLFKAETEAATMKRIMLEPIPRLSSVLAGVHPALDDAVARALDRDPDRRYQTATEMADTLERAAREAALASPNEVGVASPREVAGYVQAALGQDIAAQRESVRAWLAHSEPSLPSVRAVKPGYDVTVKLPLDRQKEEKPRPALKSIPPSVPPARTPTPGPLPRTLIGVGDARPSGSRLELVTEVDDLGELDADEHDTQLMVREPGMLGLPGLPGEMVSPHDVTGPSHRAVVPADHPSRPSADFHDPTPFSASGPSRSPGRRPQVIAIVVGLVMGIGAVVAWFSMRSGEGVTTAPQAGPSPGSQGIAITTATQAPTGLPEVHRDPPPPPAPAPEPSPAAPATLGPAPSPPPGGHPRGGHGGKAAPPATAAPAKTAAPAAPPPPGGTEDLANPYR